MAQLNHDDYERLERAVSDGRRIAVFRRGTEYIVIPISLVTSSGRESIMTRNPTTGDTMSLFLDELESFEVLGR